MSSRKLTLAEFQGLGRKRFMEKYGVEKYREMGKKAAEVNKKKGAEYFKILSQAGVRARLKKLEEKRLLTEPDKVR